MKTCRNRSALSMVIGLFMAGCQTVSHEPIRTVKSLELERFMGAWYVIASVPTPIEHNLFNAVESYRLSADVVETTFTYRRGGFDAKVTTLNPKGFVRPQTGNAVWDMQFFWPFKAEYRVVYVDTDYQVTIIGRSKRDYAWIMAREPSIPEQTFDQLVTILKTEGYDIDKVRRVPQKW